MTLSPGIRLRHLALAVGFAIVLPAGLASAQETPDKVVVATVDGTPITEEDLALASQDIGTQLAQLPPEQRKAALVDLVVNLKLMARAAETSGIDKDPAAARRLAFFHDRALRNEYLSSKIFGGVTAETIKKRYDEETAKFVPGDELHLKHILVKTEDEAKAIIADLDKGGDFAAIAKEKSLDPGSGAQGGDLGFIAKGRTVKPFEDAAFQLEVGKYTEKPVQSEFGWHVIALVEKRKEAAPTLEQEQNRIRDELVREIFTTEIDALRKNAKVVIVEVAPPAPAPATAPAAPEKPAQ